MLEFAEYRPVGVFVLPAPGTFIKNGPDLVLPLVAETDLPDGVYATQLQVVLTTGRNKRATFTLTQQSAPELPLTFRMPDGAHAGFYRASTVLVNGGSLSASLSVTGNADITIEELTFSWARVIDQPTL